MSEILIKSADYISTPDENQPVLRSILLPLTQNRGTLFALVRILGKKNEKKIRIIDVIEDHFKRLQDTLGDQVNVPRRFEQVLQAINEDLGRIALEDKEIPISDFHAVIGVVHKNQIFFSGTGSLFTLFMHRTTKQRYVLYELSDQYRNDDSVTWDKLFVTVLDGELAHGDVFYLATRISAREMSIADLQDTLVTLPPSGALKRIQQHLHSDTAFGGICFHVEDQPKTGMPKKENPISSIEHLGKTKDDTAELLGEQSPDIQNLLTKLTGPILKQLSSPGSSGGRSVIKNALRIIIKVFIIILSLIFTVFTTLYKGIVYIASKIMQKIGDASARERAKATIKMRATNAKQFFANLPKVSKYIAVVIVVLIIVIVAGFSMAGKQKEQKQEDSAFQTVVDRIIENKDAAAASLIYDDSAQARQLLQEAVALLETLSPDNKQYETTVKQLTSELDVIFAEIRGITEIDTVSLARLNDIDANQQFTSLTSVDGIIYGVTQTSDLFRFQELEQQWIDDQNTNGAIGTVLKSTPYTNGFVFIDSNKRLGLANVNAKTLNPIVSGSEKLQSLDDIFSYNGNVYILSSATQQIIKMQPQGSGFDAGTSWISSLNQNISTARALSVDGDVYVLTQTGVVKFTSGKEQTFALEIIDPALQNPTEIWTETSSNYIYILDAIGSRIIVFNKSGQFVTQYHNDAFINGIQLFVRENKGNIIVATPTELLQFTATHLLQ